MMPDRTKSIGLIHLGGNEVSLTIEPAGATYQERIASAIRDHREELNRALVAFETQAETLAAVASVMIAAISSGNTILLAGNGGSAAEAQHFSAELVGRYKRERRPYAAIALSTDTSILTAIGNDYSFDEVFERQMQAIARPGDIFIALSTSGRSANLLRAAAAARALGVTVVAVTGPQRNPLAEAADITLRAPGTDTATVQELHMMFTHVVCDLVEAELAGAEA